MRDNADVNPGCTKTLHIKKLTINTPTPVVGPYTNVVDHVYLSESRKVQHPQWHNGAIFISPPCIFHSIIAV